MYIYTYIYICIHKYLYIYVYMYIHKCIYIHTYTYTYTYTYMYTYTYIHTYLHIYIYIRLAMGLQRPVISLNRQLFFLKELYFCWALLPKRPINLGSVRIVATPHGSCSSTTAIRALSGRQSEMEGLREKDGFFLSFPSRTGWRRPIGRLI